MKQWKKNTLKTKSVTLCELERSQVSIYVTAALNGGELHISGQDLGKAVQDFWGEDDYEYWLTLPVKETKRFFRLLGAEGKDPLVVLKERFHGEKAFRAIRAFCNAHGIKAEFSSYS